MSKSGHPFVRALGGLQRCSATAALEREEAMHVEVPQTYNAHSSGLLSARKGGVPRKSQHTDLGVHISKVVGHHTPRLSLTPPTLAVAIGYIDPILFRSKAVRVAD